MEQKFRDWTIRQCIGEGAFGKVYEIEREEFGHVYKSALKVIRIPQSSTELKSVLNEGMSMENAREYFYGMVEKIVEEFSLMSKLKGNSNIVSYEDHYVESHENGIGWTIYIRMELLTPLYQHIRQTKITVKDLIQLGIDICRALEICQRFHIIHRDIKPENIFVSDIGDFKLGDFGIARELEKTSSGLSKVGTKSYMAPEVFKGLEYNSTVDIYSLGIVMYRFLNRNRLPFMPPAPAVIKYSDKEKADALRMSGQKIPKPCNAEGRLAEIVLKACEYLPEDRYQSPGEMKKALEEILYSEQERNIAYPQEDELDNSSVEYVEDSSRSRKSVHKSRSEGKEKSQEGGGSVPASGEALDQTPETEKDNTRKRWIYIAFGAVAGILLLAGVFRAGSTLGRSDDDTIPGNTGEKTVSSGKGSSGGEQTSMEAQPSMEIAEVTPAVTEPPSYQLVDVVNRKENAAVAALEKQTSVKVDVTEKYSDTVKKGYVIKQSPAAGKTFYLTTDTENYDVVKKVSIVISKGEKPVVVPDLTEKSVERAKNLLTKKGLKYSVNSAVYSKYVSSGYVVYQSVDAGTEVKKGTVIVLTPSKGAEPSVPSNSNRSSQNQNSSSRSNSSSSRKNQKSKDDASLSDSKQDDARLD